LGVLQNKKTALVESVDDQDIKWKINRIFTKVIREVVCILYKINNWKKEPELYLNL